MPHDPITAFHEGSAGDHRGRMLEAIQAWDDEQLEQVHDYIQWLFPLIEPSPVNPLAPTITASTRESFANRPELRASLRLSFLRMLAFYGLEWRAGEVVKSGRFTDAAWNWLSPGNHNHLRITRILKCLTLLGLAEEARAFRRCLEAIDAEEQAAGTRRITRATARFWSEAIAE